MEREIVYTINKEFVYAGTGGKEKVPPGTLLVPRDKYSNGMHKFYDSLCENYVRSWAIQMMPYFKFKKSIEQLKELDLRKYPITYLESNVCLYGKTYYTCQYMMKELYLDVGCNFYKPLFFTGYSL